MWIVKQRLLENDSMNASNRNGVLAPNDICYFIAGYSVSGKTIYLIVNFALVTDLLDWTGCHLHIFSKRLEQPKYQQLHDTFNNASKIMDEEIVTLSLFVLPLAECLPDCLVIFHDYSLETQDVILDYFMKKADKSELRLPRTGIR